jgi:hypothetical protein
MRLSQAAETTGPGTVSACADKLTAPSVTAANRCFSFMVFPLNGFQPWPSRGGRFFESHDLTLDVDRTLTDHVHSTVLQYIGPLATGRQAAQPFVSQLQ